MSRYKNYFSRILTSQACVFPELQETIDASTRAVQTATVRHLQGALFSHHAVVTQ